MFGFSAIKKVRDEYIERLNGIYGNNLDKVRTTVHYFSHTFWMLKHVRLITFQILLVLILQFIHAITQRC